jgi:hypothetical protein
MGHWTGLGSPGIVRHVKEKKLGPITGVETLRVLAAAVGTASFTVNSMAERTGVSREAVDTVIRRHPGVFQKLDSVPGTGRGRPQVRWQLRDDAVDEVAAKVAKLQGTAGASRFQPGLLQPDLVDASLTLAADAVLRASADDRQAAESLVTAAQSSLRAAGYESVLDSAAGEAVPDTDRQIHLARVISAIADLVVAEIAGGADRIDFVQARALSLIIEARSSVFAEDWLPLANRVVRTESSVLAAPVEVVDDNGRALVEGLFPNLSAVSDGTVDVEISAGKFEPVMTSVLADHRVMTAIPEIFLPSVVLQAPAYPATPATIAGLFTRVRRPPSSLRPIARQVVYVEVESVTYAMSAIAAVHATGAVAGGPAELMLLSPVKRDAQIDFARVINRAAIGLDASTRELSLLVKCPNSTLRIMRNNFLSVP